MPNPQTIPFSTPPPGPAATPEQLRQRRRDKARAACARELTADHKTAALRVVQDVAARLIADGWDRTWDTMGEAMIAHAEQEGDAEFKFPLAIRLQLIPRGAEWKLHAASSVGLKRKTVVEGVAQLKLSGM